MDACSLNQSFDQIHFRTGVLHHLSQNRDQGLLKVCGWRCMKPDGAMQIMVYARYGREGI